MNTGEAVINEERFAKWMKAYEKNLMDAVQDPKAGYFYGPADVPGVVAKMGKAFRVGTYNKEGRAISRTCKELGIKYTYAGIKAYLSGE